jgi:hypothetical protein
MPFWEKGPSEKEYVSHSPDGHDGHDIVHVQDGEIAENADNLQRRLNNRQIQLIAIGGSIGTALFVSIGGGLHSGGPGSLFIAYTIYACMLALVNNCIAEMTVQYPVSGGFIRLAGHFVDDAVGFMAGWNFFIYEALLIPFEITALTLVLGYWSENIPGWAIPVACIVSFGKIDRSHQRKLTHVVTTDPLRVRPSPSRQLPLRLLLPSHCALPTPSCPQQLFLEPTHNLSTRAKPLRHNPTPSRLFLSHAPRLVPTLHQEPVFFANTHKTADRDKPASLSMSAC